MSNEAIYQPKGRALEYSFLAINHYTGCGHGCHYCFAYDLSKKFGNHAFFTRPVAKAGILERVRKSAVKLAGTDKRVLLSFTCDPYQPLDDERKLTRRVIEILVEFNIPFQILTKGGLRAVRDFDLYGIDDAFATTLTFLDESDSLKHEPNAATPTSRIEAIREAHATGIQTWVSLEPVIDAAQSLQIIRETHGIVDLFKIGTLNHRKSEVDYRKFALNAIALCDEFAVDYYIKDDLKKHIADIDFKSVDTRKIKT